MRRISCLALACVALAAIASPFGCKDDGPDDVDGGDLGGEFSQPSPPDMLKNGCAGFSACIVDCFSADPNSTLAGCQTQCNKSAKTGASMKWSAAFACGQEHCLGDLDAGGNKCTLNAAMDRLIDRPGDPANTCSDCLGESLARLFGDACTNMSSPDCNPASCKTVTDACFNDLP